MCLFYILRPLAPSDRARLGNWDRSRLSLDWHIDRGGDGPTLSLHGCDMVREWDRPSGWKLPKKHRTSLHADLATLFGELAGVLELTATWSSDSVEQQVELTRPEVLGRVLTNQIANRTTYTVSEDDARE